MIPEGRTTGLSVVLLGVVMAHLTGCGAANNAAPSTQTTEPAVPTESAETEEERRAESVADVPISAAHKRALIVAIGNYQDPDVGAINAGNDVPLIRAALEHHQFPADQTVLLQDADASREAIEAAFQTLIETSQPGDMLFFHFSGHGQQVPDLSGDEPDGFDEALIAWDGKASFDDDYTGQGHVLDDDLGKWLDAARARVGPQGQVVAVLDACNSGSSHRKPGEATIRGIGPAGPRSTATSSTPKLGATEVSQGSSLAPLVMIAGARHDQLNFETTLDDGTPVGSLTWALANALTRANTDMSWAGIFAHVTQSMAARVPQQQAQLEGAGSARVFDGAMVEQVPWVDVGLRKDDRVQITAGTMRGIFAGAEISFFPAGTASPEGTPLATGTVEVSQPLAAVVRIDRALPDEPVWGFVTMAAFPDVRVRLQLAPEAQALRDALTTIGIVELTDTATDLELVAGQDPASLELRAVPAGTLLGQHAKTDVDGIRDTVTRWARARYLGSLELNDPQLQARLELSPVEWVGATDTSCGTPREKGTQQFAAESGEWRLQDGDGYQLTIHNEGLDEVYATVLSITEDGIVTVMYPHPDRTVAWDPIPAGTSYTIQELCYEAAPPLGREMLKLVALPEKVDLRPVVEAEGMPAGQDRGNAHPLLSVVADTYEANRSTARRMATGTTDAVLLRIVE